MREPLHQHLFRAPLVAWIEQLAANFRHLMTVEKILQVTRARALFGQNNESVSLYLALHGRLSFRDP